MQGSERKEQERERRSGRGESLAQESCFWGSGLIAFLVQDSMPGMFPVELETPGRK